MIGMGDIAMQGMGKACLRTMLNGTVAVRGNLATPWHHRHCDCGGGGWGGIEPSASPLWGADRRGSIDWIPLKGPQGGLKMP